MTTLIVTWTEDITGTQCKSYFSEIQEQYMDIHSIDGLDHFSREVGYTGFIQCFLEIFMAWKFTHVWSTTICKLFADSTSSKGFFFRQRTERKFMEFESK